jgi:hypothetical protein
MEEEKLNGRRKGKIKQTEGIILGMRFGTSPRSKVETQ